MTQKTTAERPEAETIDMEKSYTRNGDKINMAMGEYGCGSRFHGRRVVRVFIGSASEGVI